MKTLLTLAVALTLLFAGLGAPPAHAAVELSVYATGPETLQAGLSGT